MQGEELRTTSLLESWLQPLHGTSTTLLPQQLQIATLKSFQDLSHSNICPINGKTGQDPPVPSAPAVAEL